MKRPLITIITVVYNTKPTLEATIKSVLQQDKELYEYWIIDGKSSDGSIEIIHQYEDELAGWISERDEGIYDAMNKGIEKANGEWLYFLGADDMLEPGVLAKVSPHLTSTTALVYGDIVFNNGQRFPSLLGSRILLQNTVHHQGAFYNVNLFTEFRYNTNFSILSDYELNLKIYRKKLPVTRLSIIIACCRKGGASSNMNMSLKETNDIRANCLGNGFVNKTLSFLLSMYYTQKQIRSSLFGK